ncbi:hypothetical protein HDU79_006687 [Rhizoclosmatium sp. JEL0117]|nr:hypothetical protein HDU79_006687 [Rhizoclosmatium sp. JEL0117]
MGNVPTIQLKDGTVLNENVATLLWIAENAKTNRVSPPPGSSAAHLLNSKLSWVATELHPSAGPLFNPKLSTDVKTFFTDRLHQKITYLNNVELKKGQPFLVQDDFSVVDAYAYIVLSWSPFLKADLTKYPNVQKYFDGIKGLDFVKEAHALMAKDV